MRFRGFAILSLVLLIVSGSGISYMFSIGLAHNHAQSEFEEFAKGSPTEQIRLANSEFEKLKKDRISEQIFEISYNGKKYDVFRTKLNSDNTVTLDVSHDNEEEFITKNFEQKNSPRNLNSSTVPFYFFGFSFENTEFGFHTESYSMQFLSLHNNLIQHCNSPLSPPPEFGLS